MKTPFKTRARRGFTLIELMVVVLIIAVLAALVVPKLTQYQDDAKYGAAKGQIARIASILQKFRLDCDRFPTSEEGLNALMSPPGDATGWKGPYLDKIPNDPWDQPYYYQYPGPNDDDSFILGSGGKNKIPNDDDDVSNLDL